jgi:hypothetical protein
VLLDDRERLRPGEAAHPGLHELAELRNELGFSDHGTNATGADARARAIGDPFDCVGGARIAPPAQPGPGPASSTETSFETPFSSMVTP